MKKITAKLRTGSFWVALAGALTLILSRLGYESAATLSESIVEGIASVLLVLGIAISPVKSEKTPAETNSCDEAAHNNNKNNE